MVPRLMSYGTPLTTGGTLTDATSKDWARAMTKPVATRSVMILYIDFPFHTGRLSHDVTGILYQCDRECVSLESGSAGSSFVDGMRSTAGANFGPPLAITNSSCPYLTPKAR